MNEHDLPLAGLRVVEVAQNLAGPYCGQILHDLGAEVTKVEPPGGDPARGWGPPFVNGTGSIFVTTNRGKRSVALDLRADTDRNALRALIETSDVVIEALRPDALNRLGFDYATCSAWNPRVIYCSVLPYGETGPLRDLPGYDPLMQAHGGLMSVTGAPGGEPVRTGTSIVDMGTGMWLTIAVLAALRRRDATGTGCRLSVSLYETALAWNAYHLIGYAASGFVPGPLGSELAMIAPYGTFATRDRPVMIAAANDRLFRRLCEALGLHALRDDVRFSDNARRVEHRGELRAALERETRGRTAEELIELLREAGVPCAPVQDIGEVARDPQTQASGLVGGGEDGPVVALPLRIDGRRPPARGGVPRAEGGLSEPSGR